MTNETLRDVRKGLHAVATVLIGLLALASIGIAALYFNVSH